MNRQVSYNGPMYPAPLPCTFPASRPSILMNHPLPPKPPISMHFRTYTFPARKPETTLYDMAAQHVDHGKPIPLNDDRKRPVAHHHATASSIGELSGPHIDSVICPSRENTITRLKNGHNVDGVNGDDLSHPDELFSWIQNNSDARSCEASVAFPSVDDRSGLNETSSTTPNDCGISLSCVSHPGDVDDIRNDDTDPTKIPSDGSEGDLSGILRPIASCQPSEESETISSGCSGSQPVTETAACSSFKISRSKCHSRKKPACAFSGYAELAAGRGPRTRARTRAEASDLSSRCRRAQAYSDIEDELLRKLVHKGLSWELIEEEFGRNFAGRDRKSLQGRWRNLKFAVRPTRCSRRRGN
ncbi:hypothetical protein BDV09DRAFT_204355 [Aspergillus tetrazonus]